MPWRVTIEVLCNVHAATFKFKKSRCLLISEIDVYQRSRELKEIERTTARIFLEVIKGKEFNGSCNISV